MAELIQNFLSGQVILFLLFGLGALVSAVTMVLYPNPIRSALFLVLNLFCVAVLYVLLNAYFLAAVQVIVYAGAIMVLFLFVIMLLNLGTPDRQVDRLKWQQPAALVGGIALALVMGVTLAVPTPTAPEQAILNPRREVRADSRTGAVSLQASLDAAAPQSMSQDQAEHTNPSVSPAPGQTEQGGTTPTDKVESPEAAEGATPTELTAEQTAALQALVEQGTTAGIGRNLYNPKLPYLFPFEVTSILLLIAVIGSVVLAKRRMPNEDLASSHSETL